MIGHEYCFTLQKSPNEVIVSVLGEPDTAPFGFVVSYYFKEPGILSLSNIYFLKFMSVCLFTVISTSKVAVSLKFDSGIIWEN